MADFRMGDDASGAGFGWLAQDFSWASPGQPLTILSESGTEIAYGTPLASRIREVRLGYQALADEQGYRVESIGAYRDGVLVFQITGLDQSITTDQFRYGFSVADIALGGNDTFQGSDKIDIFNAGGGNDTLDGADGDDVLSGEAGADALYGGAGHDRLIGGAGSDTMAGGAGDDIYIVENAWDWVDERAGQGIDTVYASVSYALAASAAVEFLSTADAYATTSLNLTGNGFANHIYGNAGSNRLDGKGGADRMYGNGGNDTYVVDHAGDRVTEPSAGGAADRVYATVSHTLSSHVERLYASGGASISLTGNTAANVIHGNGAANKINGRYGNDTLKGGAGKDAFIFNTKLSTSSNRDVIVDFSVTDDSIHLDNAVFAKLGSGSTSSPRKVSSSFFTVGSAAKDWNDYVIYNRATGVLSYDSDGWGPAKAIQVAKLAKGLALTYSDIYVV